MSEGFVSVYHLHHTFRPRDPGGPPGGLGSMSARDRWRYAQSFERFRRNYGPPIEFIQPEVGVIDRFRFITWEV